MLRRRPPRPTPEDTAIATLRLRRVVEQSAVGPDYEVVSAAPELSEPAESFFFDEGPEWPDEGDERPAAAESAAAPLERGRPAGPSAALAALLPGTLSGGRLSPGRSGVAALALVATVAVVGTGLVVLRGRPSEVPLGRPTVMVTGRPSASAAASVVVVDVAGKVRRPGVLTLPAGARVVDALKRAGGALPGVPTTGLNLARRLVDGEQLLVGLPGAAAPAAGGAPAGASGGLLNLNTATVSDLETLDGVGPVLAQRIVDWRTDNGGFTSVDQLREVTGIGDRKFEAMVDQVTV